MSNFKEELVDFLRNATGAIRLARHEVHEMIERLEGAGYTITPPADHAPLPPPTAPVLEIAPIK